MATPNIQNLFERFLQIYGGQTSSTDPTRSVTRHQSSSAAYSAPGDVYGSDDGYAPTGGVLRTWGSPSLTVPSWARAPAGPGGMPVGLGGPRLSGGIGSLPLFPMPPRPEDVVEIPDPHLETVVPKSTRDFWNVATSIHRMLMDHSQYQPASSPPDPNIRELRKISGAEVSPNVSEVSDHPLRHFLKGMYGDGATGDDAYSRCVKAAEGDTGDWEGFCRFLDRRQNNTVGGESQNQACWSKAPLSKGEKRNYCYNQFSKRQ